MSDELIDSELHAAAPNLAALLPYMSEAWAERFRRTSFMLPNGALHPGGGALPAGTKAPGPAETAAALPDGVRAAILVPHQVLPAAGWCDTHLSAVYASALNAYFIEHWLGVDPRFRLALAISAHEPDLAAEEIRRYQDDDRIAGIAMSLIGINMGQRHYRPILEAAAAACLPVIVHPGGQEGTIPGMPTLGGIGPRHPGEYPCLIGQVAAANMASLIYDGVFSEYPQLQIVFAGFGLDWIVPVMWHADMEWRNLRVDIPWVTQPPSSYMGSNVRVVINDCDGIPPAALRHLASLIPQTMLIYGSNAPFVSDNVEAMAGLPPALHARVAHLNAQATFGSRVGAAESATT